SDACECPGAEPDHSLVRSQAWCGLESAPRSAACLKPQQPPRQVRPGMFRGQLWLRTRCGVGHSAPRLRLGRAEHVGRQKTCPNGSGMIKAIKQNIDENSGC